MITYPSTHGVFEAGVTSVCEKVHAAGGQVYIDGANLNALVGVAQTWKIRRRRFALESCTKRSAFRTVAAGLVLVQWQSEPISRRSLPKDGVTCNTSRAQLSVQRLLEAAAFLPISWMYIRMMGSAGLRRATQVAILNANYVADQLKANYPILYTGQSRLGGP